jgi:hypothetical protein
LSSYINSGARSITAPINNKKILHSTIIRTHPL